MNKNAITFIEAAEAQGFAGKTMTRDDISKVVQVGDVPYPYWLVTKSDHRVGKGVYQLPRISGKTNFTQPVQPVQTQPEPEAAIAMASQVLSFRQPKLIDESDSTIPAVFPDYVPFGFFKDLSGIIKSKIFYPVFITGLSGNGKTLMVEQVCAQAKRECIRVNISIETDETDLLGGYALINGNTVYRDGPVLQAMKKGAILLIDEIIRVSDNKRLITAKSCWVMLDKKTGRPRRIDETIKAVFD